MNPATGWTQRLAAILMAVLAGSPAAPAPTLEIVLGVSEEGVLSEQWLAMIRRRLPAAASSEISTTGNRLSDDERAWADLIRSRAGVWEERRKALAVPFYPVGGPGHVLIVLGNRGGEDGFTHDETTIGFDLSALHANYGAAQQTENLRRIDRFFDHEYTHLLQKAWLAEHPYEASTPQRAALLDIWLEGLGNYRSLSERWREKSGHPSEAATGALAVLEPRLAARMSALACAPPGAARSLMSDLSMGRFDAKWGALPAALWLESESGRDPEALRRFVLGGPDGVWDLAARHVPGAIQAVLVEARKAASICPHD